MIPAEAVEAAARMLYRADGLNLWEKEDESTRAHYLRKSTSALEAAAPHLMRSAWDEGATEGHLYGIKAHNPHRPTA